MKSNDLAWAAFRTSLISPLLTGEIPAGQRGAYFRKVAAQEHVLPNGKRGGVSVRTLWRWYQKMRKTGLDGMVQQPRSDRGRSQKRQQERIARAVALKREQPSRSHRVINKILRHEFGVGVSKSTLYRHLRMHGATRRQLGLTQEKVRCRWTRDLPNALWQGDFEHGPVVLMAGQAKQTRLSAWIDSHSRYIVAGRYYPRENTGALVDSLLRAWSSCGTSTELYVDNAKVYYSQALTIACARLTIRKLHRPPREPQPGGLIERFFQTVQSQFEAEVRACQTLTLPELNELFGHWLQTDYHQTKHSGTDQTPHERYFTERRIERAIQLDSVLPIFHLHVQRTVDRTHSDVSLNNAHYRVDPKYRTLTVWVSYDPFVNESGIPDHVELWSEQGVYWGTAPRYSRERGAHSPPTVPPPQKLEDSAYFRALREEARKRQEAERQDGINFHSAMSHGRLTATSLCQLVAHLLGRKGGLSELTSDELQALHRLHQNHPHVQQTHVRTAFERASPAGFTSMLWELQQLLADTSKGAD